jgi:hypothetical protein
VSKNSGWEPAEERPYTVALSLAEVHALINHHISQTKRCTKFVGNKLLKLSASSPLPTSQESKAYIEEGRKIVEAHISRAKGLQSFLKP